jgi:hypothetical protein
MANNRRKLTLVLVAVAASACSSTEPEPSQSTFTPLRVGIYMDPLAPKDESVTKDLGSLLTTALDKNKQGDVSPVTNVTYENNPAEYQAMQRDFFDQVGQDNETLIALIPAGCRIEYDHVVNGVHYALKSVTLAGRPKPIVFNAADVVEIGASARAADAAQRGSTKSVGENRIVYKKADKVIPATVTFDQDGKELARQIGLTVLDTYTWTPGDDRAKDDQAAPGVAFWKEGKDFFKSFELRWRYDNSPFFLFKAEKYTGDLSRALSDWSDAVVAKGKTGGVAPTMEDPRSTIWRTYSQKGGAEWQVHTREPGSDYEVRLASAQALSGAFSATFEELKEAADRTPADGRVLDFKPAKAQEIGTAIKALPPGEKPEYDKDSAEVKYKEPRGTRAYLIEVNEGRNSRTVWDHEKIVVLERLK